MKKILKLFTLAISITILILNTSCSTREFKFEAIAESQVNAQRNSVPVVALDEDNQNQIMKLVKRGYSNYGYISLDSEMKQSYKEIEYALLNVEEKVVISEAAFEQFNLLLRYISSDNPLFFWEPNEINYTQRIGGGYIMNFKYDFTKEEIFSLLTEIDNYANEFCNSIPTELSNFDKALIVHDKIVSTVEYDKTLSDKWRNDVYGGLINKYATCLGYSKTYQYLMCRLSVDTLMAYGYGGDEQHAWNVINLDGNYYHVDTTFNDTSNLQYNKANNYTKIQHEYAFLNDEEITKTHDILSEEFGSYPLPECNSLQRNYFKMKDLIVTTKSIDAINSETEKILINAINIALAEKNGLIEIKFENDDIANEVMRTIENGELDSRVTMLCKMRGISNVESRSYVSEFNLLTYYFS